MVSKWFAPEQKKTLWTFLQIYDKITSGWVVAQSVRHKQKIFKIIFYKIMITGTLKEIFVTTILNNITYIVIVLPEYIVHWKNKPTIGAAIITKSPSLLLRRSRNSRHTSGGEKLGKASPGHLVSVTKYGLN